MRDFSTFKFLTDAEFARNNNISRARAGQLRKIHAGDTDSKAILKRQRNEESLIKSKKINDLILKYIKINYKNVSITKFLRINNLSNKSGGEINKQRFEMVAIQNNINIIFRNSSEYDHGIKCTDCHCEIGKLAQSILNRHRRNHNKSLPVSFVNYLANEYIEFYKEDDSSRHSEFYKDIDEEIVNYFGKL